jgi:hypothetical protein
MLDSSGEKPTPCKGRWQFGPVFVSPIAHETSTADCAEIASTGGAPVRGQPKGPAPHGSGERDLTLPTAAKVAAALGLVLMPRR